MFSPQKAAQKANVSRKTIMNAIKSMELKAHRNNENYWVIKPTDLANWMKDREIKGGNTPTYHPTGSITPAHDDVSPVVSPSIPTPEATTNEAEFKLQLAQMELRHTQEKLDNSDKEVARLRTEVSELKEEVREARKETSEAWSMFTTFMKLMGDKPSAPDPSPNLSIDEPPVVAEVTQPEAKPDPFLLLPEYRVDLEETDELNSDNIFIEPASNQVQELELTRFVSILKKINDGKQ